MKIPKNFPFSKSMVSKCILPPSDSSVTIHYRAISKWKFSKLLAASENQRPITLAAIAYYIFIPILLSALPIMMTMQQVSMVRAVFDVPCTQKLVGSKCLFDEECYGQNTVCRESRCTCPTNFEEFDLDAAAAAGTVGEMGSNSGAAGRKTVCRLAPSKIGESCQRDCKPPLLCRDGKCECWGGSVVNGKCVVSCPAGQQLYGVECTRVAHLGQQCEKDSHCVDPFTSCVAGQCQCAAGSTREPSKNRCTAVCPDGRPPHQTCRRLFINDIDMLENAATTDSCPIGFRCVTYGSPYVGHCCRLRCPFGEPDLTQSCDAGAPEEHKCRPLTHFCFTVSEPGWKTSLCCPRPCRDPTPIFSGGQCLSLAHRDDPCQSDQQCEGGVGMYCALGICECRPGFHATNDGRFPSCEKSCPLEEVPVIDRCVKKVGLGERCAADKQCAFLHSECRFGLCQCICGFRELSDPLLGTRCANPDDPLSINTLFSGVEELFKPKLPSQRGAAMGN